MLTVGLKDRTKITPERDASGQPQPMRAALQSGEWADFVDEVDHDARQRSDSESAFDASNGADAEFATMFLATSPRTDPRELPPPSSSRTAIGLGRSTERKLRTLDPREPSVETTRLDLFTVPAPGSPPASAATPSNREGEPVPPSYRTRIGLYYVPRDPATEPTLPLADLAFGDEATKTEVTRHFDGERGLSAWLRKLADRLRGI